MAGLPDSSESDGDSVGQVSEGFFDAEEGEYLCCLEVGILAAKFLDTQLVRLAVGPGVFFVHWRPPLVLLIFSKGLGALGG